MTKNTDQNNSEQSSEKISDQKTEQEKFNEEIQKFLRRNFPQIQMHGGESTILKADPDKGNVEIQLSGACSGCGISPMTTQAIITRMKQEIEQVQDVQVITGMSSTGINPSTPTTNKSDDDNEDNQPEAPF